MERTIRVTGKGRVSVKPDMVRINMTIEDVLPEYDKAISRSAQATESLKDIFVAFGFERSDLKTKHFHINTEYESYRDKNNDWKQKFVGYKYVHRMKLEFPSDNELLGKILYAVAHAPAKPEFSIEYTVSDPESSKNILLANAIKDSKEKAIVLCDAAEVELGEIITIDYSWGEIDFVTRPMESDLCEMRMMEAPGSYNIDIEPDDIDVTDTVTAVWKIS